MACIVRSVRCLQHTQSSVCSSILRAKFFSTTIFNTTSQPQTFPVAQYGGRFTVTMLPGDGIGPELMNHVKEVFRISAVPVDFEEVVLDFKKNTQEDFENAVIAIKRNHVALKGSIESKYGESADGISRNAALRTELDLFANVLYCKSFPNVPARFSDVDIVIIRQNTEGEYSMLEHETVMGVVESMKVITRTESERLARYAFNYAQMHQRRKVTAVHKANIMKLSDGLFLETCKDVAKEYPKIEFDSMIVDNTCMQLVVRPHQFDVIVLPNLYGNVVNNVVCGLVGGAGLVSGCNYGLQIWVDRQQVSILFKM